MLLFSVHMYHGHSTNTSLSSDLKQTLFAVHARLKIAKKSEYYSVFIGQNEVHDNQKVAVASSHVEYTLTRGQIPIILIKILNSFSVLHSHFIKIEMV